MSRYNRRVARPVQSVPTSFITTASTPSGATYEGSLGFNRDAKSELFLLAVSTFLTGEKSFYESGKKIDSRFQALISNVAATDPVWMAAFLRWLRADANIRTAAIVGALEAARTMVKARIPGSREIVSSVLLRADEPGEALAYWLNTYGRRIPKPVKRGIADAAQRRYDQYGYLKYDSEAAAVRFADVMRLCHVEPKDAIQGALFQYILNRRFNKDAEPGPALLMIRRERQLRQQAPLYPQTLLNTETLKDAGFTHEDALSLLGSVVKDESVRESMKRTLWEQLIPNMGYMALLRNLRNFSEARINQPSIQYVVSRLIDVDQVAKSRQLPFRFLSAFKANSNSVTWGYALETALQLSLQNVPELPGRTLVLVDVSGSMSDTMARDSTMRRVEVAGLFGAALAVKNGDRVTLRKFAGSVETVPVPRGASILSVMNSFVAGGGTYTRRAVQQSYQNHDRVIIITDEQGGDGDPTTAVPAHIPVYTWNVGNYPLSYGAGNPRRYTFGGLTDHAFNLIPLLEAGDSQTWPFMPKPQEVPKTEPAAAWMYPSAYVSDYNNGY